MHLTTSTDSAMSSYIFTLKPAIDLYGQHDPSAAT